MDDIIFLLSGNRFFTVIDLTGAYLQISLDTESQKLTTINTHEGLFQFMRLPFGIKVAPSLFQSVMDKILQGLAGVSCYFDDILASGRDLNKCIERTKSVLDRLAMYNVQANFEKCQFYKETIEY